MRAWVVLAGVLLSGCVAQRMASEVGRPVEEIARRFGPPAQVQYITGTSALYVWTLGQDLKRGPQAQAMFQPVADYARAQKRYGSRSACEFHVIARRREGSSRWVVDRVLNPGLGCS